MVKSIKVKLAILLSLFLISGAQSFANSDDHSNTLVFGVHPHSNASYYSQQWKSLIEQIGINSGQKVRLEIAPTAEEFEQNLNRGTYDFVLLNAHLYTQAHDSVGYQAFAKEQGQKDKGVIVVRNDSDIKSLADLKSKTLAFSDPRRYASSLLTRAKLNEKGIAVKTEFVESDNSVYRAVVHGDFAAGAGEMNTFNNINPSAHSKLRVIWTSKQYSSSAFAAHPRVDPEQVARIRDALIGLNSDIKGKQLLSSVKMKGIAAAKDSEWNDVRDLKRHLAR